MSFGAFERPLFVRLDSGDVASTPVASGGAVEGSAPTDRLLVPLIEWVVGASGLGVAVVTHALDEALLRVHDAVGPDAPCGHASRSGGTMASGVPRGADGARLVLRCAPVEASRLRSRWSEVPLVRSGWLEIEGDARVREGDALLETPDGVVDLRARTLVAGLVIRSSERR